MSRLAVAFGLLILGAVGGFLAGRLPIPGKAVLLFTLVPLAGLYLAIAPC
jgi:hypothetical protein